MGCCVTKLPFEEDLFGNYKDVSYLETRGRGDSPTATPAFMVFYPSKKVGTQTATPRQYFRRQIIDRGITFEMSLKYLLCLGCRMEQPFPVRSRGEPLGGEDRFPIVFFSHGLFGSMEMYSNICRHLASMGMVVVAIEHEDGSACYAQNKDGDEIYYRKPPAGIDYSDRDQVRAFRKPMLEKRTDELLSVLNYFHECAKKREEDSKLPPPPPPSPNSDDDVGLLSRIMEVTDLKNIQLCGHSFGATSTVRTVHQTTRDKGSLHHALGGSKVQTRLCLDLWPWCLPEEECETDECQVPSLFLESHAFMRGTEVQITKQIARKTQALATFGYVRGSVHQQFADPPLWWPTHIGTRLGTTGEVDRHEAYRAIVMAVAEFIFRVRRLDEGEKGEAGDGSNSEALGCIEWSYDLPGDAGVQSTSD